MNEPGQDPAPEEPAGPTHGLDTHEKWWGLIGALLRTYPRALVPIMVAACLPMVPLTLLALPWELWLASDSVVVNGARESFVDPITPGTLAGAGVLLLLTLAVSPVAAGSGVLIAATALLGRRIRVRDAWRQALRRYWTGLTWVLAAAVLLVAAAAAALWALSAEWEPMLVSVLLVPVLLVVWPPLMVTLPVALVEGHNPWRAFARAWVLGRQRRRLHLGMVVVGFGLLYMSGTGLEHALTEWTPLVEGDQAISAAQALLSLPITPMVLLLLSAPVAFHGRFFPPDDQSEVPTPVYMDLERVDGHIPAARPAGVRPRAVTVVVVAAALIVPPLVTPVVVAADPFSSPELTGAPLDASSLDGERVEMWVEDDRAVVSFNGRQANQLVCDPRCELVEETPGHFGFGPLTQVGEAYVYPEWVEVLHEDEEYESAQYAPHEESGLYLHVCEEPGDCELGPQVRPFAGSHHDVDAVAAPVGGELVVVSHVRSYDYDEEDIAFAEEGDTAGLRAHVCADTDCEDPVALDLPEDLSTNAFLANGHHLDLEPVGEGFLLLVTDAAFGAVHALHCPDTACSDMEVTELAADTFDHEYEDELRTLVGARAIERSDGTSAVMLREAGDGSVRVLDCQDAACTEYTEETVTGPGWVRPVPGFDLDSQERPQLLTPDLDDERMLLVSCLDRGCTEAVETPLTGYELDPRLTGLALDDGDRPHIVWGDGGSRFNGGYLTEAQYLRCEDAWCGAEVRLDSQVDGEQAG
ncbi:hypothetical protein IDM40_17210 [Nocardiopsis sp. HNM0947]|uniref:Uncharacterized protein n=1 Tax=Nocardiopsis coralli TaxID=2772213 RepID=A0ABR9P9S1_9ACTN|nr:hypothetical protein [Nocardiopsis coralli]MBE3000425.1 hypothetical protein [Nocardiopsis coralli]